MILGIRLRQKITFITFKSTERSLRILIIVTHINLGKNFLASKTLTLQVQVSHRLKILITFIYIVLPDIINCTWFSSHNMKYMTTSTIRLHDPISFGAWQDQVVSSLPPIQQ